MNSLRVGQSRAEARGLAEVPMRQFRRWLRQPSNRKQIKRAESEFSFRHAINLNAEARETPEISKWLLSHSPVTKKRWDTRPPPIVPPANFNILTVLTAVEERRKALAALAALNGPHPIDVIATRPDAL